MPLFRGVSAEVRRISRDAAWVVSGVRIGGSWHPAERSIQPASARLIQSGLVALVELPDVLAPDIPRAVKVALWLAREDGLLSPRYSTQRAIIRGSRTLNIDVDS